MIKPLEKLILFPNLKQRARRWIGYLVHVGSEFGRALILANINFCVEENGDRLSVNRCRRFGITLRGGANEQEMPCAPLPTHWRDQRLLESTSRPGCFSE
jgi:hypothetical protein